MSQFAQRNGASFDATTRRARVLRACIHDARVRIDGLSPALYVRLAELMRPFIARAHGSLFEVRIEVRRGPTAGENMALDNGAWQDYHRQVLGAWRFSALALDTHL